MAENQKERPTVLVTGARAPVALEWARQWAAAGWRVLVADSMPRPLAGWSRSVSGRRRLPAARQEPAAFCEAVAAICEEESVDLIVPTCEEIFTLAAGRRALPDRSRLWAAEPELLDQLHHKARFMELAAAKGLIVPRTRWVTAAEEIVELGGDWYLKPCYSRFARTGRRWKEGQQPSRQARQWLESQEISAQRPWVAQEFLDGTAWCSFALVEHGRILDMTCYPVEWTAGAGACVAFRARPHAGVESWVEQFVKGSGFSGQLAFDFIEVAGRGILPIECNPRATSGLHLIPGAARRLSAVWRGRGMVPEPAPEGEAGGGRRYGQLTVPMLLYGLPQAVHKAQAAEWLAFWRSAPEVTAAPGDPWPAWAGNFWTLAWFAAQAVRLRCGLTAATTADLEWNGPSDQYSSPE